MKKVNIAKLRGSGVLVVVLSSIAFTIYVMSTYSEQEHFGILQDKYEKDIISQYEKNIDDIPEFYTKVLEKNK